MMQPFSIISSTVFLALKCPMRTELFFLMYVRTEYSGYTSGANFLEQTILEIIRGAGTGIPIDLDYLSPYYHHLFTFALATAQSERTTQLPDLSQEWPHAYHDMAESVIDEVLKAASGVSDPYKECRDGDLPAGESSLPETDQLAYPISELRYLATSSFNQAMDFYSAENDRACLRWARKAVLLAESMGTPEGEELVSLFQSRLKALF
jgi:hypothetical protein